MSSSVPKQTFWILLGVYTAAFLIFLGVSIFSYHGISVAAKVRPNHGEHQFRYTLLQVEHTGRFPGAVKNSPVLSSFVTRWIAYNTVILFSRYMLAVTLTGILLCYSLVFPFKSGSGVSRISFNELIGKNIILFLVFTAVYFSLYEGVSPGLQKAQHEMAAETAIALDFFHEGRKSLEDKKFTAAHDAFSSFLVLDRENKIVQEALTWTAAQMEIKPAQPVPSGGTAPAVKTLDYFGDAEKYFKDGNYFSAYYYAFLASETEEKNLKEKALRLMAETEKKISTVKALAVDKKKRTYYKRKMAAVDALKSGRYYDAYYAFKELRRDFPRDRDLVDFFNRSRSAVQKNYFFVDEIRKYAGIPGVDNIMYVQQSKSGIDRLVRIKKFIQANDGRYFFSVEVLAFSPGKGIIEHYTAPYGKLSTDGYIILKAMERNEKKAYTPTYLVKPPSRENISAERLIPSPRELILLRKGGMTGTSSILDLIDMWRTVGKFGYLQTPLEISLLESILLPFTFFIFSMFAVSIGWFFRIRRRRIPAAGLLLVPILPFVLHRLVQLYLFGAKGFYAFFLFKTGLTVSLALLLGVQALLLFWSLLGIARQGKA